MENLNITELKKNIEKEYTIKDKDLKDMDEVT